MKKSKLKSVVFSLTLGVSVVVCLFGNTGKVCEGLYP